MISSHVRYNVLQKTTTRFQLFSSLMVSSSLVYQTCSLYTSYPPVVPETQTKEVFHYSHRIGTRGIIWSGGLIGLNTITLYLVHRIRPYKEFSIKL